MDPISILVLALGLSLDAMAAAATRGLSVDRLRARHFASVALWFGIAQGAMASIGSGLGSWVGPLVSHWDHWIAFGLLTAIGAKMVIEALRADDEASVDSRGDAFAPRLMAMLAFATSVDALAVGVTLPMLGVPVATVCAVIGVITALMSALGLALGRRFGALLGRKLDVAGGVVLILLGIKILVEHLSVRG